MNRLHPRQIKRRWPSPLGFAATGAATALLAMPAPALEIGGVRALQAGPLGDGFAFTSYGEPEVESHLGVTTWRGYEDAGDAGRLSTKAQGLEAALGYGVAIGPELTFQIDSRARTRTFSGAGHEGLDLDYTTDSSQYHLEAGPSLRLGRIRIGGTVGLTSLGEQTRRYEAGGPETKVTVSGAVIPVIEAHAGYTGSAITTVVGVKTFNLEGAEGQVEAPEGRSRSYDTRRTVPGELRVDMGWNASRKLRLGTGLTYRPAERSSETVHHYQAFFTEPDPTRASPSTSPTGSDHVAWDFGGAYEAQPWISFIGGIHYRQPGYANKRTASLELENLGGYRLDIGTHYRALRSRIYFNAAYRLPRKLETRAKGVRPWFPRGESVTLEQEIWDLELGGSLYL